VGTLLDTTVFIEFERELRLLPTGRALAEVSQRLLRELGAEEEVGMAAITASELLHGVHRANPVHRASREAFVETLLDAFPPIPFDFLAARAHARIWSDRAASGTDIGAHDRLVAATAVAIGWRVATANVKHYERVASLTVVVPNLSA